MHADATRLIATLRLEPLRQEGGYFRQTWSGESGSAILFLITAENFSALHRLAQDEVWHFYAGDAVEHLHLDPSSGHSAVTRLGPDLERGDLPQVVVRRGVWQGARVIERAATRAADRRLHTDSTNAVRAEVSAPRSFALLGCTVSPPWDPAGFELGERDQLLRVFPGEADRIRTLTR